MNILGALVSFLIVLLIGVPLSLLIIFTTIPAGGTLPFLGLLAQYLLGGFLVVYVFAVFSSILFATLGHIASLLAPNFRSRWVVIWFLSLFYLAGTVAYLILLAPPLFGGFLTLFAATAITQLASSLALTWQLLALLMPLQFIIVLIVYICAGVLAPRHDQYVYNNGELFVRGLLIGLNAGMNLLLGATSIGAILTVFLGPAGAIAGLAAGVLLAVVNLLPAAMPTSSQPANAAIKFIVGWMSWVMPTNWIAVFLGWILYQLSALFNLLLGWTPFYGLYLIDAVLVEWPYGSLFIEGGIASNLWLQGPILSRGAYNLGLFSFYHADTVAEVDSGTGSRILVGLGTSALLGDTATRQHESGHNLSLTAFGSLFHLVGGVDENVGPSARGRNAYSERLADSNVPGPFGSSDPANTAQAVPLPFWTF